MWPSRCQKENKRLHWKTYILFNQSIALICRSFQFHCQSWSFILHFFNFGKLTRPGWGYEVDVIINLTFASCHHLLYKHTDKIQIYQQIQKERAHWIWPMPLLALLAARCRATRCCQAPSGSSPRPPSTWTLPPPRSPGTLWAIVTLSAILQSFFMAVRLTEARPSSRCKLLICPHLITTAQSRTPGTLIKAAYKRGVILYHLNRYIRHGSKDKILGRWCS